MSSPGRASRAVTLRDVAQAASVSLSTASEALSGRGRMSAATRRRVVDAADDLGYVANALGKGLRTGRTHAIGLHHQRAASSLDVPYFRAFLAGAIEVAHRHDYDLAVLSSNPAQPRASTPRVDGVIVVDPIGDDRRARELMESALPVVAGEHIPDGMPPCAVVAVDHATALRAILDQAAARGVRAPVLVAPDRHSGWGEVLRAEFTRWCDELRIHGECVETEFAERSIPAYRRRIDDVLSRRPDVDLVVSASSAGARAALAAVRDHGRVPGEDVLVAACADDPSLELTTPAVTAVELPGRTVGAACAERLISLLDEASSTPDGGGTVLTIPTRVRLRASTGTASTSLP